MKTDAHSCNIDNDNDDDNDLLEIALCVDDNDARIENNATLKQNIINNNTAYDDAMLRNYDEEQIIDNNHFCDEFKNKIENDEIQNITSGELVNDVHVF